ncbi:fatty acyl-AMP ligase [Xanthobacter sp. V4C-4]|uniref:fatty acyl-AMP ligase n=1 Tax=Xanthobacter cornucopiae TaxID=3119924 RepID=UPI00372B534C
MSARDLRDALFHWAAHRGDVAAFTFMERGEDVTDALTFAETRARASRLAARLRRQGAGDGPAVLLFPPGLRFVEALFGCLIAGVVAVPVPYPVNARARARIGTILAAAGATSILTTARLAADPALVEAAGGHRRWIAVDAAPQDTDTDTGDGTGDVPAAAGADRSPEDVALIQFTSGSTSAPRGVTLSFGNLQANHTMIGPVFGSDPDAPAVTWLPMFHDMGLIGTLLHAFQAGRTLHIMPPFAFLQKPARWLRAISRTGATTSGAPSFAYDLCARALTAADREGLDLRRWTVAFCGAEPVRSTALERFAAAFAGCGFDPAAFLPCYGLAEATLFVSGGPAGSGLSTSGGARPVVSCGQALGPQRIAIVDADGRPLPEGETGEIWIAGPHVSRGYWRDPEATRRTFGATLAEAPGERFLRSGDLGALRGDTLFVTGRIKDILIVRGAKHHGDDLDRTVCAVSDALLPGAGAVLVADAAAAAGEPPVVAVHEVGRRAWPGLDRAALAAAVKAAVTREHGIRLERIVFVREGRLPRTTSGKIQRHLCLPLAMARDTSTDDGGITNTGSGENGDD